MTTSLAGRPNALRREPLWDRVDRNRWLLVGYLLLFTALGATWTALLLATAALLGNVLAAVTGFSALAVPLELLLAMGPGVPMVGWVWGVGVVVTLAYEFLALARSERRLLAAVQATFVPKGERLDAKHALKDMAIASGMPMAPALFEVPSNNVNAFVAQAIGRRAVVGVTAGFLDRLTPTQQRAVFANLIARLRSGDARVATAISALVAPLEHWRSLHEKAQNDAIDAAMLGRRVQEPAIESFPLFGVPMVVLGEVVAAAHRRAQLRAAEKADAEGMLLLKDPPAMLSALTRCVELDNVVPTAGEAYGELFYCWTGDSTNDDDDPEWRRVARLREVLGVEGWAQ